MRKIVLRGLAGAVLAYALVCGYMFAMQRELVYHGGSVRPVLAETGLQAFKEVTVPTADGLDLLAWQAPADNGKPTILFLHGNAGTLADKTGKVRQLNNHGYGVLVLAWRGFSGNPGNPSEDGLKADARAGLDYLYARGLTNNDVVLYGESLGSGVAAWLAHAEAAAGRPLRSLVLYTPYTRLVDVGAREYPWLPVGALMLDRYDTMALIADVQTPVLVLHGTDDKVVPIEQGRTVYDAAPYPKFMQVFVGGQHNDLYDYGAARVIAEFLEAR